MSLEVATQTPERGLHSGRLHEAQRELFNDLFDLWCDEERGYGKAAAPDAETIDDRREKYVAVFKADTGTNPALIIEKAQAAAFFAIKASYFRDQIEHIENEMAKFQLECGGDSMRFTKEQTEFLEVLARERMGLITKRNEHITAFKRAYPDLDDYALIKRFRFMTIPASSESPDPSQ